MLEIKNGLWCEMQDKKQNKNKKDYQKPEIQVIDLAADEVLAIGCKTTTSVGYSAITCFNPSQCSGPGS